MNDDIEDFALALRAAGKASKTIRTYTDSALWLRRSVEASADSWEAVTRQDIRSHLASVADKYSAAYTSVQFRSLQQFFIFLTDEGLISENPMLNMKPVHVPPKLVPVITDELDRIMPTGKTYQDIRDRAIFLFFASTGCRLSEVSGLRVHDVNLHQMVAIVTGKASRMRVVRFDAKTALAISRYLRVRKHPSEFLWIGRGQPMGSSGIYQIFKRRSKKAGVKLNPHRMRHDFAHRYLSHGGQEGDLMQQAGWNSPAMIRRYGASAAAERAAANYDKVMGR